MAKLSLERVSKQYEGGIDAVKDLSLQVEDGSLCVLTGPRGSGKTTVLRLAAGLETATGGTIRLDGIDVTGMPARERGVAMMMKNSVLYPDMTVRDNLAFGLRLRKRPEKETAARVEEMAGLLNLTPLLDVKPDRLTRVQKSLVAIGRAAVHHPVLLLIDGPLSEPGTQAEEMMKRELRSLREKLGFTILYTTDDPQDALSLAGQIAVLRDGCLQQAGTAKELRENPASRFVAAFAADPALNVLRAEAVRAASGRIGLETVGGTLSLTPEKEKILIRAGYVGKPVLAGIGAAALIGAAGGADGDLAGTVRETENAAPDGYAFVEIGDTLCLAKWEGGPAAEGEQAALSAEPDRIFLFDPQTEQAITGL